MPLDPRPAGRVLLVAFLVTVLAFLGSTAYTEVRLRALHRPVERLTTTALPSIESLVSARAQLRRVEVGAIDRAAGLSLGCDLSQARANMGVALRAYLALPSFPGEPQLLPPLERAAAHLERTLEGVSGPGAAAGTDLAALHGLDDELDQALGRLISWNARQADRVINDVDVIRRGTMRGALLLNAVSLLLAGLMITLALRTTRRHTRFLKDSGRLLRERATEMEAFAGRVAHDVRQPLNTCSLALAQLEAQLRGEPKPAPLATATQAMRRAGEIVAALLTFAQAGARPDPAERSSAARVVEDVIAELRPSAEAAQVELRSELGVACDVACSASLLDIVLSNLLSNAIKYMGDDRERRVTVRVKEERDRVGFEVEDTGPGIAPQLGAAIFEPYVRAPGSPAPGIGLGLATVRRIVEGHGGAVGVRALPGRGCLFWLHLPKAAPGAAGPRAGGS